MSEGNMSVREVSITPRKLGGFLTLPEKPEGLVLFAHGSGSSRFSPRNTMVADRLNKARIATLLFDLLTEQESRDRAKVFDIALLAARLSEVAAWARDENEISQLPIGYFGASTGAGAALVAASKEDVKIAAVVSRGGRPDLAPKEALNSVQAPTLLIVGSKDEDVMQLNRQALRELQCEARLEIISGATHLFEETGTLERVSDSAAEWFIHHFRATTAMDNATLRKLL